MSKTKKMSHRSAGGTGVYAVRDKSGRIITIDIVAPKKRPTSVNLSDIRQAVRATHASRKSK